MIVEVSVGVEMWRVCECGERIREPSGGNALGRAARMPGWWWEHVAAVPGRHSVVLQNQPVIFYRLRVA